MTLSFGDIICGLHIVFLTDLTVDVGLWLLECIEKPNGWAHIRKVGGAGAGYRVEILTLDLVLDSGAGYWWITIYHQPESYLIIFNERH